MKRKTLRTLFLAAVAAVGFCRSAASALFVDLHVTSVTGPAEMFGPHNVVVTGPGAQIVIDVWARIVGHQPVTVHNYGLYSLSGSFVSGRHHYFPQPADLLGPMHATLVEGFNRPGVASVGLQTDLDADGDLDVGGLNPQDDDGYFTAANSGGGFGSHFKVGRAFFDIDSIGASASGVAFAGTLLSFVPRQSEGGAMWWEDGLQKNPTTSDFYPGFAVSVSAIPEPAALGLLAAVSTFASALRPRRKE